MSSKRITNWQSEAAQKRQSLHDLIPSEWILRGDLPPANVQKDVADGFVHQYLSDTEVKYTEAEASTILRLIRLGRWTARDVVGAFCHRAALAHQMTNCLHEIFFEAALDDAQRLDDHLARTGTPVGPLHGLPVSLKDQLHVKGVETTMGYVGWIGTFEGKRGTGKEKVRESELVRELRELGAVLYCKTSVPHTLISGETINNIIGYVPNPKNRLLSAGGSSGGEGALLALRGSPLGFGTDIGGSIRIPAAFNGLYGLKPSSGRIPYEGMANSMDGQNSILSVIGPMATSVETLKLCVEAVLGAQPWLHDPLVVELPWRESIFQQAFNCVNPMAFGLLLNDGQASVHPPVSRALNRVADTLTRLGHKVIDWKPPSHKRGVDIAHDVWAFDGGHDLHAAFSLSGEPISDQIAQNYGNEPRAEKTASQIAAANVAKRAYQKEYMDYWNSTSQVTGTGEPVVAVITPVAPFAAARPGRYNYYGYTTVTNVLDYSAVVIPVTTCDRVLDSFETEYVPFSALDEEVWKSYDPEVYHGTPVGVQLVGRRLEEEKVLGLATMISREI
ncbi:Acetamidase [Tolypocladium ophioglossoides CBS 100239]|uniref:amidase n=1 Tax=Tolypocladium ophioglossoides (strain CBS 100239) TaxID=1163406 RepID=A0A0L0MXK2_TOLOC|nr:Acetamidase [Tolypocladium ophioglossoides CBS 100239]